MLSRNAPIGVFDSGVGGLSVLRALRAELPAEHFVYVADAGHAPYGERGDAYVAGRTLAVARTLVERHGIRALVIACNTATAAAIHLVRHAWPALAVVGVEPALKPAVAASRTQRIGVLATRGTLGSAKFSELRTRLSAQAEFVCQPCDGLAEAIERHDRAAAAALCHAHVRALGCLGETPGAIDTLVLGCTHYPLVADLIQDAAPGVRLIDTGAPVARQTRQVLATSAGTGGQAAGLTLLTTGNPHALQAAAARWLGTAASAGALTS